MRLVHVGAAAIVACALAFAHSALAIDGDEADAFNAEVIKLYSEGKYAEAIPIAKKVFSMREKALGPGHPQVATALNNLAGLYDSQGRFNDAEPLYKRSLSIREKALGPDHPDVATSLNNLAVLYESQGRYGDAEPLYKRSLSIREKALGLDHPDVAASLNNLAGLYDSKGHFSDAEPLYKRSLTIRETVLGTDHPDVANSLNNLAALYESQARYADAEPLYKRSLSIRETVLGPDHPDVATSLNNLAALYDSQGRYGESEPLYKRSLSISETSLGLDHPDVALVLNNLAELYRTQGRYDDAEPLYKRSLTIREKALGPDHPRVATLLSNLAALYESQSRFSEAEPLYKRSLTIREKALGLDHPDVAISLNNMAGLYKSQGRYGDAEVLYNRSLSISKRALGPDHPSVATSLNNLAGMYRDQGRYRDAEPLFETSLSIREKALGPNHPDVAASLNNLAWLSLAQSDWREAADRWHAAGTILQRRATRGGSAASSVIGKAKSELAKNDWYFSGRVKSASRLAPEPRHLNERSKAELFEVAQWAQSSDAAGSLTQMAVRGAAGDATLASLVRERQDLVAGWEAKDKQLSVARGAADAAAAQVVSEQLAGIDARIAVIDRTFKDRFPDYAALTSTKPASIADIQAQLRDREALVLFLDTSDAFNPLPEETFVWVVTKTESRWVRSDLGTNTLRDRVAKLRCGLDRDGEWQWSNTKGRWYGRKSDCSKFRPDGLTKTEPLPFDLRTAYELYEGLFGDIEDLIAHKDLLLVPAGALTALPFQVLVTERPVEGVYNSAAWLIKNHALTVLPSVASLAALRRMAKSSAASAPLIAFANPVLERNCASVPIPDRCPGVGVHVAEDDGGGTRSAGDVDAASSFFRNGLADVAALNSRLCSLPETAFEVACVAKSLGVDTKNLLLGKDMTESVLKKMKLDQYRIVHFATHGLLPGETAQLVKERAEPALVMTPPVTPSDEDDGLLTASEVTTLKLDADWVVISACNTAAGAEPGAQALSGLAKAFFYAGARALLVSHWPVDSYAATVLTSRTFAELKSNPTIGRSEAFRRAMLAVMSDEARPAAAHPSIWAPFVVVGEGGVPATH